MLVGRVMGHVVSSHKVPSLTGSKLLIVQTVDLATQDLQRDYVVCVDDVGAGVGDLVFCAYGSSARQSDTTKSMASDYSIYGIIDTMEIHGKNVYDKAKEVFPCNWPE